MLGWELKGVGIMFQCDPITTADLVLIFTTIVLAAAAFIAPYWVSRKREEEKAPKLVASYDHKEPMARRSARSIKRGRQPVYDFHFLLENNGRSPARKAVAEIVEFRYDDGSGKLLKLKEFMPVPLRYHLTEFVDVYPERPYYWNIGSIFPEEVQKSREGKTFYNAYLYDVPGKEGDGLRFELDLWKPPHEQVNVFLEGRYGIKVVIYSENADPAEILLHTKWSGKWKSNEDKMLDQIKIKQVQSFD
jgi:hypothetical protein